MNKYGIQCYIIDDFGYVFLSGDELDLGRHISDVDGPLFHSLSRKDKIFKPYKMKDYQVNENILFYKETFFADMRIGIT